MNIRVLGTFIALEITGTQHRIELTIMPGCISHRFSITQAWSLQYVRMDYRGSAPYRAEVWEFHMPTLRSPMSKLRSPFSVARSPFMNKKEIK